MKGNVKAQVFKMLMFKEGGASKVHNSSHWFLNCFLPFDELGVCVKPIREMEQALNGIKFITIALNAFEIQRNSRLATASKLAFCHFVKCVN